MTDDTSKPEGSKPPHPEWDERTIARRLLTPQDNMQVVFERNAEVTRRTEYVDSLLIPSLVRSHTEAATALLAIHKAHFEGSGYLLLDWQTSVPQASPDFIHDANQIAGTYRTMGIFMMSGLLFCPDPTDARNLMGQLCERIDELFPPAGGLCQDVREHVFAYLSAIQTILLFIHPFAAGNGRVSEDLVLLLAQRAEVEGLKNLSASTARRGGRRQNEQRQQLTQSLIPELMQLIQQRIFPAGGTGSNAGNFSALQNYCQEHGVADFHAVYNRELVYILRTFIRSLEQVVQFPTIQALAKNLQGQ